MKKTLEKYMADILLYATVYCGLVEISFRKAMRKK
jgi:NTP pyrophosphatase (non-canonical NTP hydrolase)